MRADEKVQWGTSLPFFLAHAAPVVAFFVPVTAVDFLMCGILYWLRMFFITGGYHRYFSHRSYRLSRPMQFLMGVGGTLAFQKGPLWWAAIHRHHHRYSDQPEDAHSPKQGFWWSHVGWILSTRFEATQTDLVPDLAKFPELRWLNRYHLVPPLTLALGLFLWRGLGMLAIGFFLSTVFLWHGTFTINSLAHLIGKRRFATSDTSKNSWILAIITCGEGWHNNHHHSPSSARQGFYWWEIDVSYYVLRILGVLRIVRDIKQPSEWVLSRRRVSELAAAEVSASVEASAALPSDV